MQTSDEDFKILTRNLKGKYYFKTQSTVSVTAAVAVVVYSAAVAVVVVVKIFKKR